MGIFQVILISHLAGGDRYLINEGISCFLKRNDKQAKSYKGFLLLDIPWDRDFEVIKATMPDGFHQPLDTLTIKLFKQFLQDTKMAGIKVIFFYAPEYFEGQKYVTNREEIFSIYNAFAKEYQLPFLDYSSDSMSYNKKYFYNATHLNKTGSEMFSKKLASDIKKLSL